MTVKTSLSKESFWGFFLLLPAELHSFQLFFIASFKVYILRQGLFQIFTLEATDHKAFLGGLSNMRDHYRGLGWAISSRTFQCQYLQVFPHGLVRSPRQKPCDPSGGKGQAATFREPSRGRGTASGLRTVLTRQLIPATAQHPLILEQSDHYNIRSVTSLSALLSHTPLPLLLYSFQILWLISSSILPFLVGYTFGIVCLLVE